MRKRILLVLLLLLLLPSASAAAQTPTTCITVSDGQVCMEYIQNTPVTPTPTGTSTPTVAPTVTSTPTPLPNYTQMTMDLYRNPGLPLTGYAGLEWYWAGTAASSSIVHIYADYFQGREVVFAKWQVAWNPNTDATPTGIQLSYFPLLVAGTPITMGTIEVSNYHTPRTNMVIVTNSVQDIINSGIPMQVMEQTHGNGTNGALIYSSTLYIVLK